MPGLKVSMATCLLPLDAFFLWTMTGSFLFLLSLLLFEEGTGRISFPFPDRCRTSICLLHIAALHVKLKTRYSEGFLSDILLYVYRLKFLKTENRLNRFKYSNRGGCSPLFNVLSPKTRLLLILLFLHPATSRCRVPGSICWTLFYPLPTCPISLIVFPLCLPSSSIISSHVFLGHLFLFFYRSSS
jgi:hypothetical protein